MFVRGILSFLQTPGPALLPRPTPEPRISQSTLTEMLREQQAKDAAVSDEDLIRAQLNTRDFVPLEYQERSARANLPQVRKKMRLKTMENFANGDVCKWNARSQQNFAKKVAAYEALQRAANKKEKEIKSMLGAVLQVLIEPESPVKGLDTKRFSH